MKDQIKKLQTRNQMLDVLGKQLAFIIGISTFFAVAFLRRSNTEANRVVEHLTGFSPGGKAPFNNEGSLRWASQECYGGERDGAFTDYNGVNLEYCHSNRHPLPDPYYWDTALTTAYGPLNAGNGVCGARVVQAFLFDNDPWRTYMAVHKKCIEWCIDSLNWTYVPTISQKLRDNATCVRNPVAPANWNSSLYAIVDRNFFEDNQCGKNLVKQACTPLQKHTFTEAAMWSVSFMAVVWMSTVLAYQSYKRYLKQQAIEQSKKVNIRMGSLSGYGEARELPSVHTLESLVAVAREHEHEQPASATTTYKPFNTNEDLLTLPAGTLYIKEFGVYQLPIPEEDNQEDIMIEILYKAIEPGIIIAGTALNEVVVNDGSGEHDETERTPLLGA
jgi:hypothetical protein